jgi:hypothetical protein
MRSTTAVGVGAPVARPSGHRSRTEGVGGYVGALPLVRGRRRLRHDVTARNWALPHHLLGWDSHALDPDRCDPTVEVYSLTGNCH